MASIVEVKLELGHRAKIRDVPSPDKHTHDWVIFVKGSDGVQLEHFVEKVVFWLHESYEQPKRVIKHPPYKVEQSGFAGFNMLIDVHFRNKEDPKMVRFQYDLFLHTKAMPPVNHTRLEKLTFTNPTEDFRKKLLAAGAELINRSFSSSRSKEKSSKEVSPGSKKDREKTKTSKHRDRSSSTSGRDGEEKKKSSSHVGKKDGRIAMKDMKHHEDNFKQPKNVLNTSRGRKDSESGDKSEPPAPERGRPEKRRSFALDEEGNKKKKKRHSEEHSSASKEKSKPPNVSASSSSQNQQKREKSKVKKIKEKPDVMAGLFAPESSININQIKQSKEKVKHESNEVKIKKEKSSASTTPSHESPRPAQDGPQYSKVPAAGDLTLKLKRDKSSKPKKEVKSGSNKEKKKNSTEREKAVKDASVSLSSKETKLTIKRTRVAMSSDSSSSSSDSDMNISENDNMEPTKISPKETSKSEKHKSHESFKTSSKVSSQSNDRHKSSAKKSGGSSEIKKEPKTSSKPDISRPVTPKQEAKLAKQVTSNSEPPQKKNDAQTKHKKSSKEERKSSNGSKHDSSQAPPKKKKQKRSSKERREKSSSRKISSQERKSDDRVNDTTAAERVLTPIASGSSNTEQNNKVKHTTDDYPMPGASFLDDSAPPPAIPPLKISPISKTADKKPRVKAETTKKSSPKMSKEQGRKHSNHTHKKRTPSRSATVDETAKKKKSFKSRSFVESSSDDSDVEGVRHVQHLNVQARKRSVSSHSSSASDNESNISSANEQSPTGTQEPPPHDVVHHSSSSCSSEDDAELSEIPPINASTLTVISPIVDRSMNHVDNEYTMDSAYRDMEMSDSSGDSPFHDHPPQEEAVENPSQDHTEHQQEARHNFVLEEDLNTSSSEDEEVHSPMEKPFQYHAKDVGSHSENTQEYHEEPPQPSRDEEMPYVTVKVDTERQEYPHLTAAFYEELRELQRKLAIVTDVDRLRKIASIVAKSQKLQPNHGYFDFDLCSLDHKTIHKIQKQLKAL